MCDFGPFRGGTPQDRLINKALPNWAAEVRARPRQPIDPGVMAPRAAMGADPQGFAQKAESPLGQRLLQFGMR